MENKNMVMNSKQVGEMIANKARVLIVINQSIAYKKSNTQFMLALVIKTYDFTQTDVTLQLVVKVKLHQSN